MGYAVNLVCLCIYVAATLIQYAHPPTVRQYPYEFVWPIVALSYPFCLALVHKRTRFWRGLLTIMLFPVFAQALEAVIYLLRTNGFQSRDTDTVVILGFYLIGSLVSTAIWFPIGYFITWLLFRRALGTSNS